MKNFFLILAGKLVVLVSKISNKGNGSTWPGHIALSVHKNFLQDLLKKNPHLKVVFIVGTNGKTTTGKMITTILEKNGKSVFQNTSGANLLNGIASSFIRQADISGKITEEFAVFEVDENMLPLAIGQIVPFAVVALNLFRDQLDRYGELDSIAKKWKLALAGLPVSSHVILNGDDPQIAFLGDAVRTQIAYFGIEDKAKLRKTLQHAADTIYCPKCSHKLVFSGTYFSHIGIWHCPSCGLKRPVPSIKKSISPLPGVYNEYNTAAAVTFAKAVGISQEDAQKSLEYLTPAFGRQEKILFEGRHIQLFLAKNPTSFNQSIRTVVEMGGKHVLFVLNDRIPDGRDVSWIWDMDIEQYVDKLNSVIVSGDRTYDMALRMHYADVGEKLHVSDTVYEAIQTGVKKINTDETLYILPTYSAMLETRKILTGKKIL
ncbi:MAG: DUF1727 domain-containing protein [Patescibacteria group bacterium]|nr:DUF1727 domain-containing protein [Patescibacteria group bacterium]MDE2590362.1 DUF1727 domain-containing protein [Patescibacteria group bacterium]